MDPHILHIAHGGILKTADRFSIFPSPNARIIGNDAQIVAPSSESNEKWNTSTNGAVELEEMQSTKSGPVTWRRLTRKVEQLA